MTSRSWGIILVFISAAAFGAMPIFTKLAYEQGLTTISLLFLRFTIATICLGLVMWWRKIALPRGKVLGVLIGLGAIGYTGQAFSYFYALRYASAGLVSLLLYLYPVLVMLLSLVINHEPITRIKIITLVLAGIGMVLTISGAISGSALGIGLGVLSACLYALYIIVSARAISHAKPLQSSTVIIASAMVMYGLMAGFQGLQLPQTGSGWLYVVGIAIISTVIAITTFLFGVERIGATNAAMLSTIEPVISVLLAVAILNETIQFGQIVGGGLILIAVLLISWEQLKTRPDGIIDA